MSAWVDRCRFNPTTGGTTDWTFSTLVTGYMSPALCGAVNGKSYKVVAESSDLSQWEISEGTYNSGTGVFARTTVLYNSAGTGTAAGQSGAGTKINFLAPPQVAVTALKEDMLSIEEANTFTAAQKTQAMRNLNFDTLIVGAVDLDTIVEPGTYVMQNNTCTNTPYVNFQGYLEVIVYRADPTNYYMQRVTSLLSDGRQFMRIRTAGSWNSWHQVPQTAVGVGTFGQHLTSNGSGGDPAWGSGNRTLLNTMTASNSASLVDTTSLTANYQAYEIDFDEILAATNGVNFEVQIRSGGAFKTTGYLGNFFGFSNGSATNVTGATVTTFIPVIGASSFTNTRPGSGRIRVANPSVNAKHMWRGEMAYGGTSFVGNSIFSGLWDTAGAIDGFQILMSSGNITSGVVKVYGVS